MNEPRGAQNSLTLPLSPTLRRELSSGSRTSCPAASCMIDSSKSCLKKKDSESLHASVEIDLYTSMTWMIVHDSMKTLRGNRDVDAPARPSHHTKHSPQPRPWLTFQIDPHS